MENSEHRRNPYIDILKGIAIILVVFGHCLQYGSGDDYFYSENYFANPLFKCIYSFHMPLFAMISGYLFSYSIQKRTAKKILIKQFCSLVIPVVAWTLTITFIDTAANLCCGNGSLSISWVKDTVRLCLTNLWFLWGIFWCSLAVILIRTLFRDHIIAYSILLIVLLFVPSRLNSDLYVFLYPYFISGYLYIYIYKINKNLLCFRAEGTRKSIKYIVIAAIAILYCILLANYDYDHYVYTTGVSLLGRDMGRQLGLDTYRWLIGFIGSILVMIVVKLSVSISPKVNKILAYLGTKTMGIYIISNYLNTYVLLPLCSKFQLNYICTIIETIVILFLSCIFAFLIGKQKILKKIFLGGR